jgi:pantothenate kinase
VGDIYGGDYGGIGLSSNMIASSFGKLKDVEDPAEL